MNIAVIGWGSLVWEPRSLDIHPEWREDGPRLPIEFARFSSRDRLTLVLVDGVPLQPTLWALSKKQTLADAARDLRVREETSTANIGSYAGVDGVADNSNVRGIIRKWLPKMDLDGVVWAALGPNRPDKTSGLVMEEERIAWIRDLVAKNKAEKAREYVERTPAQIVTPLRVRIRKEFGWE